MSDVCLMRCEYSEEIGFGHLMRCLALARELKSRGYRVLMLSENGCPNIQGRYVDAIEQWYTTTEAIGSIKDAIGLVKLAKEIDATLLILDFYNISASYQMEIHGAGLRWLQFDGFASQPLWADWVVSMSPAADIEKYLIQKRNSKTVFLLGPKYAILRPDFKGRRDRVGTSGDVGRVLLSFGGGDDQGMTLFCLDAIGNSSWKGDVVAIVGRENPHVEQISSWAHRYGGGRVHVSIDEPYMAGVMSDCDMAVISGGMTTFEAAALGLPTLMICLADNQRENIKAWDHLGVSVDLGDASKLVTVDFIRRFLALAEDENGRREMSRRGREIVDGRGAERVAEQILGKTEVSYV